MAKCKSCGREGKVIINTNNRDESFLGLCQSCANHAGYEERKDARNKMGSFLKKVFG